MSLSGSTREPPAPDGGGRVAASVSSAPALGRTSTHPDAAFRPSDPPARPAHKVCIMTGGGDAPGLNAVLRGFVRRADQLGLEVWGSENGFEGLIEAGHEGLQPLTMQRVRGILPRGGSILGCSSRSNPFAYPLRGRRGETRDASQDVLACLREHAFDGLVLVGGDGTMYYARCFESLGVACLGIPKTIDNDLHATDLTFGFETAVNTATWAIDALHSTAEAHDRVMILEVMGRYAGWIALYAGIAGGADVILLPELPYDVERVAAKIHERTQQNTHFTIVVVAEGAVPKGYDRSEIEGEARPGQPRRLGGAGELLARLLEGRVEHEVRVTVLGHLQRGGSPAPFDRLLGTRMGTHAAELCSAGRFGRMVVLRGTTVDSVRLEEVEEGPRLVNPHGQLCAAARATGIELGAPA